MKSKNEIEERLKDLSNAIDLSDKRVIITSFPKRLKMIREIEFLLWVLNREPKGKKEMEEG